ncbi:MAG: 30S ribosomal protein S12 methylthiotransferase RimO [Clostridiales bacterium]|jgi:ribosomal protein S12 methylthiotransferase|nr:30S ribosomal protein S12 methylthiotransferase RimO [Clostridiales bacterium]
MLRDLKIGFISLGCDKNRVDTEYMMAELKKDGYSITNDKDSADIIVVNTCGFINSAKTEAIDTIFETAELKKNRLKKLVVTGCFAERYGKDLFKKIPEIDAVLGVGAYDKIKETIDEIIRENDRVLSLEKNTYDFKERVVSTPSHYAYLRIADGCDNRCAYCAIPFIRGAYRSRTFESVEEELKGLKENGSIKELILVAQDVTRYGIDLYKEYSLLKLLDLIEKYEFPWVRLLYCYPELVTDALIKAVSGRKNLCKYLDIPLQHISGGVLKSMNRKNDGGYARRLIEKIRGTDGEIAIRSTFITGYPTESEEDFLELCGFIEDYKIENAGFFAFSKEEGTAAARLKDLHHKTKQKRLNILRALQAAVIEEKNKGRKGKIDTVLYEGIDAEKGLLFGRNQFNAPEIDSLVYLDSKIPLDIGRFYTVEITGTEGVFDLKGRVIS